ncbi:siderophore ABC transporter substrate-binding protein [Brucella sp. 22210]|uniref:siderophore ABC transporter substrate-binding protein n=1 Tax=Brucella sp. 22210 TaxID=3453892 RepID=UPI003F878BB2
MYQKTFIRNLLVLPLLSIAMAPTYVAAQETVIHHAHGETKLSTVPQKVAVFDLAALDILHSLGVKAVAGVPKTKDKPANFPAYLGDYAGSSYAAVGTLFEPDEAALQALKPDLIIVGGRSRTKFDAVAKIAPSIDITESGNDIAQIAIDNTEKLAKVFGAEDAAAKRIETLKAALTDLRTQGKAAGTGLVLFSAGRNVSAQPPGSRFGVVYDFVGIKSVMPQSDASEGGPRPKPGSPEAEARRVKQEKLLQNALAADPDWLFILDRSAAVGSEPSTLAARLGAMPEVTKTRAWQQGHVVFLNPKLWYQVGAGIDALTISANELSAALRSAK